MVRMHGFDEFRCDVNSSSLLFMGLPFHDTYTNSTYFTHMMYIFSLLVHLPSAHPSNNLQSFMGKE